MSIPHTLHQYATTRGITLPLPAGPRTVLGTHPRYAELVSAASHPASTGTFLARLVDDSQQLAGATR